MSWVAEAFLEGLTRIDNDTLVHEAARHVLVEGEWTDGKIRPSLLGSDCMLATVKRFRGHLPQPNYRWMAARNGLPSANTNLMFARGFLGEGMAVAALKYASQSYLNGEGKMTPGLGLYDFEVLGCAPMARFQADPDYEAHPDLLAFVDGELELVQMKCPSVFAFNRYDQGDTKAVKEKYANQAIAEMVIARKSGLDVQRNHVFLFTWEGWAPGTKHQGQARTIVHTVEWEPGMDVYVESLAAEIREANRAVEQGGLWPQAYPQEKFDAWPCSYCSYPRVALVEGQIPCTENQHWETKANGQHRPPEPPGQPPARHIPPPPPVPTA